MPVHPACELNAPVGNNCLSGKYCHRLVRSVSSLSERRSATFSDFLKRQKRLENLVVSLSLVCYARPHLYPSSRVCPDISPVRMCLRVPTMPLGHTKENRSGFSGGWRHCAIPANQRPRSRRGGTSHSCHLPADSLCTPQFTVFPILYNVHPQCNSCECSGTSGNP